MVVVTGDYELRRMTGNLSQVRRIARSLVGWYRHQRSSIINPIDSTQRLVRQIEDIANKNIDVSIAEALEFANARYSRLHAVVREKLINSQLDEFNTGYTEAVRKEPTDIGRLAAQRDEYAAACRQVQIGKVIYQVRIRLGFVKPNIIVEPSLFPGRKKAASADTEKPR